MTLRPVAFLIALQACLSAGDGKTVYEGGHSTDVGGLPVRAGARRLR